VFVVDRDSEGVRIEAESSVDGSRKLSRLTLTDAPASRLGDDDADTVAAIAHVRDRIGIAAVVDGVGAAARALELAVEYAQQRIQFGQPIGAFQAIQHLCADMLRAVELGRAAGYYACWADEGADAPEAHRAATLATAFGTDDLVRVAETAIQVFAGVGFTWEHDIHLYFKRLLTLSYAFGTADEHLAEIATIAID
jgi:alkylation response protein AidB-like acyl-CoA dehydrogenase